jgi:hypothetical protein
MKHDHSPSYPNRTAYEVVSRPVGQVAGLWTFVLAYECEACAAEHVAAIQEYQPELQAQYSEM